MKSQLNTRVLVIDDEEVVRDSLQAILVPKQRDDRALTAAAAALFEDEPVASSPRKTWLAFQVDAARSGMEGVDKVRRARADSLPYAVIFLDMRMPGWDGLETAQQIRRLDQQVDIIFLTAYGDHTIEDIVDQAGANVGYHCKPFAPEEIRQMATKGVYDWNKLRDLERLIACTATLRTQRCELDTLLHSILDQVADFTGTDSALLARRRPDGSYESLVTTGRMQHADLAMQYLTKMGETSLGDDIHCMSELLYIPLHDYCIVSLIEHSDDVQQERLYLVQLFIEHAAQAIENCRLQEKILLQEKLSAIGQAVSIIAHDIRSPISTIMLGAELAEECADDAECVSKVYGSVTSSAEDIMNLVNDILDFVKKAPVQKTPCHVQEFMSFLREKARYDIHKYQATLQCHTSDDFVLSCDPHKLQRVCLNLIRNACQAMGQHRTPSPTVIVTAARVDGDVHLCIADNGPGTPPDIQASLFEPFVTHGKTDGTGLGLAIVKQIVDAHGGAITVTSSPHGTTFSICLPDVASVMEPADILAAEDTPQGREATGADTCGLMRV